MNRNAANALLKVFEEPPSRALLILISHRAGPPAGDGALTLRHAAARPARPDRGHRSLATVGRPASTASPSPRPGRSGAGQSGPRAQSGAKAGGLGSLPRPAGPVLGHPAGARRCRRPRLCRQALATRARKPRLCRVAGDLLLRSGSTGVIRAAATGQAVEGGIAVSGPAVAAAGSGLERWLAVWEKTQPPDDPGGKREHGPQANGAERAVRASGRWRRARA